jgi:hypothetical protein
MRRCRGGAWTCNVKQRKNRETAGGAQCAEMVVIARGGHYSNSQPY